MLCHHAGTEEDQARWIAGQVKALRDAGTPLRDVAVLYRAHYVTRTLEDVFLEEKLPYVIYSGVQFYDRAEIKDALCYLRMIAYKDDLSFARVANTPKRNLGQKRMAFLRDYAAQHQCTLYEALRQSLDDELMRSTKAAAFVGLVETFSAAYPGRQVSEVLSALLDQSGYETALRTEGSQERLDNLAELKQSVHEYEVTCGEESTLEDYLAHVALYSNSDLDASQDAVKLMTVHTAKGLEFPYVFICSLSEGIFPSKKVRTLPGMEEERRLAFVAMTRAEKGLFLSEAEGRNHDGSFRYPSRFVLDVDRSLLEFTSEIKDGLLREARDYIDAVFRGLVDEDALPAFEAGQRVSHGVFGPGTVVDADPAGQTWTVKFDGLDTPRRLSFRVKLEKLEG